MWTISSDTKQKKTREGAKKKRDEKNKSVTVPLKGSAEDPQALTGI